MGRVIINGPPPGRQWCVICLTEAKQKQWEAYQSQIQHGYEMPADAPVTVIPWPDGLTKELQEGAYRAVSGEAPMLGVIDGLCWNHVAGSSPSPAPDPRQLDTQTKLPPGFIKRGRNGGGS